MATPRTVELSDDDINVTIFCVEDVASRTTPEAQAMYMQTATKLRNMQASPPSVSETPKQEELPLEASGTGSS